MRALLAAAAALAALAAPVQAQFTVHTEVDATKIGLEDQIQLTVTVSGSALPDEAPTPTLSNLRVAAGPSVASQNSFTMGPGGMRAESSLVYTYVLQPIKLGHAEVGALKMTNGSVTQSAPAIPIDVVAGSVAPKTPPPDPYDPFGGEDPFDSVLRGRRAPGGEPKIFVEAGLSRDRVHIGEPVVLNTYVYFTQLAVTDVQWGDPPKLGAFWSEELPKPGPRTPTEPVQIQGELFHRAVIDQKLLFPTKAGTVTIPALGLKVGVQTGGGFFGMPSRAVVQRATKPVTLHVDPIPDEPGFSGAVGHFTAQATLDKATVTLGEAATLRFEVQGSGNLKWIDRGPDLKVTGAKIYPPQVSADLHATTSGLSGSKTWEFVIVPETSGTLSLPPLSFTYFDPEKRQLSRAETAAMTLQVRGGAPGTASTAVTAAAPAGARAGGPLALRSELDLPLRRVPDLSLPLLALLVGFVLVVHGALWASPWLLERSARAGGGRPTSRGRALRRAVAELERVGRDGMSKEASVTLIEKTLHDVFGPLEETATTPETERERAAREVLQDVYFIRYAPQLGDYSEQIQSVARRAADVVRKWA
jgi:hypothetical protein